VHELTVGVKLYLAIEERTRHLLRQVVSPVSGADHDHFELSGIPHQLVVELDELSARQVLLGESAQLVSG
jgi:hypothetical protein